MIHNIKRELPMPTDAERASHLRQNVRALLADYRQRLEDLLPLRQLLKGSVYELKTRCGKPSCHCASPAGPLHASTVLSWSERGKTRLRTLPAADTTHLRHLAENYRRFRQDRRAASASTHASPSTSSPSTNSICTFAHSAKITGSHSSSRTRPALRTCIRMSISRMKNRMVNSHGR